MSKRARELFDHIESSIIDSECFDLQEYIDDGGDPDQHVISVLDEYSHLRNSFDQRTLEVLTEVEAFLRSVDHRELVDDLITKTMSLKEELQQ